MPRVDLNCDMGEGFGRYRLGFDEEVMPFITSANLACGFHASDPATMLKTVRLAKQHGVAIGAHPSFPDLAGFGRRMMSLTPEEIHADIIYQTGALMGLCASEGVVVRHVKPHGALYNQACKDIVVARAIAEAIRSLDAGLIMICLANSLMTVAAQEAGVPFLEEVFADRAYASDGTLAPRSVQGSVIHDRDAVVNRVVTMVRERKVAAIDGREIPINPETICVHGDTPDAVAMVREISGALRREGLW